MSFVSVTVPATIFRNRKLCFRVFLFASITWTIAGCQANENTVTDIDGNVYRTVAVGGQVWMAENLRVTRYLNGDTIAIIPNAEQWSSMSEGAYCHYNNDTTYAQTYGNLYNWYAISDPRRIAPEGWRIPTQQDWITLVDHLEGDTIAGGKMKAVSERWLHPNSGATNESGFTAMPGGYRYAPGGTFHTLGSNAYWWSTSSTVQLYSWTPRVYEEFANTEREYYYKTYGFSVRCVKDK